VRSTDIHYERTVLTRLSAQAPGALNLDSATPAAICTGAFSPG